MAVWCIKSFTWIKMTQKMYSPSISPHVLSGHSSIFYRLWKNSDEWFAPVCIHLWALGYFIAVMNMKLLDICCKMCKVVFDYIKSIQYKSLVKFNIKDSITYVLATLLTTFVYMRFNDKRNKILFKASLDCFSKLSKFPLLKKK